MLKKLREKLKIKKEEKEFNKPQFYIYELYVGNIIDLKYKAYQRGGKTYIEYKEIKKHAILKYESISSFVHLKSGRHLKDAFFMQNAGICIENSTSFSNLFENLMIEYNLTPNSKVSLHFIVDLKNALNKDYVAKNQIEKIFE